MQKRWHGWVLEILGLAEGAETEQLTVGPVKGQLIAGVILKGHDPPIVVTCLQPLSAMLFATEAEALDLHRAQFGRREDGTPNTPFMAFDVRPVPVEMVPAGWG